MRASTVVILVCVVGAWSLFLSGALDRPASGIARSEEVASDRAETGGGRTRRGVAAGSVERGSGQSAESRRARGTKSDVSTFTLKVTVNQAPLAEAQVLYHTTADPVHLASGALVPSVDGTLDPRAKSTPLIEGRAELKIGARNWTWVRIRADKGALQRNVLIDPDMLSKGGLRVAFQRGRPRIHAFLLDESLGGAGRGGLDLHLRDISAGGPARRITGSPVDKAGYARFDVSEIGLFVVAPQGVRPEASPPHRAVVLHHANSPDYDHAVKVALRRPVTTFAFEITSPLPPSLGEPIVLYLENLDGGPRFFPLRYRAKHGREKIDCSIPAGRYRLKALPDGVLDVERTVEVFPGDTAERKLDLKWNEASCRIKLDGLHRDAFPVTVSHRDPKQSGVSGQGGNYIGPYKWRTAFASVRAANRSCHLNVIGRRFCYVSRRRMTLNGTESPLDIPLEPATFVTVRVETAGSVHGADGWTVLVESRLGLESASLRRELLQAPFGAQIRRSTNLLLPRGATRVILWDAETLRVLDERSITCHEDTLEVVLNASGQ